MTGRKKTPNILGELLGRAPGVSEAEEAAGKPARDKPQPSGPGRVSEQDGAPGAPAPEDTAASKPASRAARNTPTRRARKGSATTEATATTQAIMASEAQPAASLKGNSNDDEEGIASAQTARLAMTQAEQPKARPVEPEHRPDPAPAEPVGLAGDGLARLVSFRLNQHLYALPLVHVERVLRMVAVTPVPEAPPWVSGVIDLHGQVISVLDLRRRFGQPPVPLHPDQRLLIVPTQERTLAVIVDEVTEVLEVPAQQLESSSDLVPDSRPLAAVIRHNGDLVLVLDATRLLPASIAEFGLQIADCD